MAKHLLGHLSKEGFNDVKSCSMLGGEYKLAAAVPDFYRADNYPVTRSIPARRLRVSYSGMRPMVGCSSATGGKSSAVF